MTLMVSISDLPRLARVTLSTPHAWTFSPKAHFDQAAVMSLLLDAPIPCAFWVIQTLGCRAQERLHMDIIQ